MNERRKIFSPDCVNWKEEVMCIVENVVDEQWTAEWKLHYDICRLNNCNGNRTIAMRPLRIFPKKLSIRPPNKFKLEYQLFFFYTKIVYGVTFIIFFVPDFISILGCCCCWAARGEEGGLGRYLFVSVLLTSTIPVWLNWMSHRI